MKTMRAALLAPVLSLLVPTAARADVVPVASGSGTGTGSAAFSLAVPSGSDRLLAVGVATLDSVMVTSVTYGAQVLARQQAIGQDGVRSEIWRSIAAHCACGRRAARLAPGHARWEIGRPPMTVANTADAPRYSRPATGTSVCGSDCYTWFLAGAGAVGIV
jgi:hypothetical protein